MCLVVPLPVVEMADGVVSVRVGAQDRQVFGEPELLAQLEVGDHVLVSGGIAIRRLGPDQAEAVRAAAAIADGRDERPPVAPMAERGR